ncbi:hypothetical protein HII31_06295 [Pseudocercospora fuligena]|uniref:ABM domain-containing protein n=1 Tax=Pseudocercospora fuligena TaxID=685502 RepID=A0A8H6RK03_9PEZI|nr:hypothetical protein HII31_06295 [Pseudocercospora fuligena]
MSSSQSNPEETHIFAILTPAPGKIEQLKEAMEALINNVHSKEEEWTPRYIMTQQINVDEPALYMFETYTHMANAGKHTKTEHFQALIAACDKDGLLAKPPQLAFTKTVGGFDLDRKKIDVKKA